MPLKPHPTDPDKMVYASPHYDLPDTPTARDTTAAARAKEVAKWKARVPLKDEARPPEDNLWLRPVYNPLRDNR